MTQPEASSSPAAEPEQPIEPQEPMAYMGNGAALFLADDLDIYDRAELWFEQNYGGVPSVYYLLGEARFAEKGTYANSPEVVSWKPRMFKVVNNILGKAVIMVDDGEGDLAGISESATMALPKIPWILCQKMDRFFRYVDKQVGTEAIVLLTYDPQIGGQEGWGFLVPKQTNSMAACKYEPDSVVDDKPDHVIIAGSVHSHPGMSAFASHTDVGDQTNFDGLHITFGWTGAKPTEYYIELQQGGGRFTLKPEQVFVYEPEEVPFPELGNLIERVEKQSFKSTSYQKGPMGNGSGQTNYSGNYHGFEFGPNTPTTAPGCPDIRSNTVVARLLGTDIADKTCPVCNETVHETAVARRRCLNCMVFFALDNEGLDEVLAARDTMNAPSPELETNAKWNNRPTAKPIKLWERSVADAGGVQGVANPVISDTVITWWEPDPLSSPGKA